MARPNKPVYKSYTTGNQIGGTAAVGILVVALLRQLGLELGEEEAGMVVVAATSILGPLVSRLLARWH